MRLRNIFALLFLSLSLGMLAQERTDILIWDENASAETAKAAVESKDFKKDPDRKSVV